MCVNHAAGRGVARGGVCGWSRFVERRQQQGCGIMDDLEDVMDTDLLEDIRRLPRRGLPQASPPSGIEPSPEVVEREAANVRVVDGSTFCRNTYIMSVLCIFIEEALEAGPPN